MNAILQAQSAYRDQTRSIRTGRSVEYEAFAQVTRRLRGAEATDPGGTARLAGALHDNRRLWTILASDVADPANPLPPELRARIFALAEFTRQHSRRVLAGAATTEALVDINTAVMRGLSGRGGTP